MDEDNRNFWDDDDWGDYDGDDSPPADDLAWDDDEALSIQQILDTLGKASPIDFVVHLRDVADGSEIRADRFSTLEDAIYFLYELGVASFSDIVEIDLDVYAVVIPDKSQED